MAKISVVIPNYNGQDLLNKNLPKVINTCPNCEIIVVDDASTDSSSDFLKKFKNVKVVRLNKNKGFANAVNIGVRKAKADLVVLLNSDVSPRANFLPRAVSHFNRDDLFAVGFADYSHENGKVVIRGRGGAIFDRGFVKHFTLTSESGKTLWVSGGSGIFDRQKFLELGGFDVNFAPFYWEDIDLWFRAWQNGYRCLFEPRSKVDHFHEEGVIKKSKSEFFIKTVSYKNQFLFVWKNISDPILILEHLLWLPYHFTKALLTLDLAFFSGFIWAILKLPQFIFDYQLPTTHYQLSDQEVLSKFAKS